jgi:hypothetical protein
MIYDGFMGILMGLQHELADFHDGFMEIPTSTYDGI